MTDWLRFLFGLEENEIPAGAASRFELSGLHRGLAGWLLAFIVTAAVILIIVLYRSERDLSRPKRAVLGALRLAALAVVVWILLDPRILTEIHLKRDARTFLLFDTSASMAEADLHDDDSRAEMERVTGLDLSKPRMRKDLALAAMEKAKLLERLAEKNRVRVLAFDAALRAVESHAPAGEDPESRNPGALNPAALEPRGSETRLGDSLRALLKQTGPDPVAAIILVSDGRQNAGEGLEKAVAELSPRGIPVHTVSVGVSQDAVSLAVTDLSGPEVAEPGFPIRIQARVDVSGVEGPVTVTLTRQPFKGGRAEKVDERTIEGTRVHQATSLVFVDTIEEKGKYRYVLTVPERAGETETSDNRREIVVTAAEEKCRVLLIAGTPTSEYRFVRNFLIRDSGLQVSCWLSSADAGYPQDGNITIREVPRTRDKLRPYDVVLLLDPDPRVLASGFGDALKVFVAEDGGGLAYVAGESFSREVLTSGAHAAFRSVLPVDAGAARSDGSRQRFTRPWRPTLTRQGADHPLCRLSDEPRENLSLWSHLPPFYYFYSPVRELKPAATALFERDGVVLAATQKAGAGYTVFIGTDELHRWRSWKEGIHERFWGAIVRYLALGKKLSGAGEISLYKDRDRYTVGEEVVFEASLYDTERKPILKERVEVSILDARGPEGGNSGPPGEGDSYSTRLNLLPVTGREGWYSGRYRVERPGRFSAEITSAGLPARATDSSSSSASAAGKTTFSAVVQSTESEDPSPDPEALEDLARSTGGSWMSLGGLGMLADRIPDRSVTEVIGRSASTVWDSTAFLLLFSGLLIVEWVLRKIWRLN